MRWGWLVILVATLAGCKALDRSSTRDRERSPGDTTSRTKPKPDRSDKSSDPHWLDGPAGLTTSKGDLPAKKPGPPPADSWADPRDPNFDVRSEVKGTLSGYVEDPDRRKLAEVFIEVQLVRPDGPGGAPLGVQTDERGYFLIKGLKSGESYVLTAKTTRDGQAMAGQVYAKPPNVYIRLALVEGLTLPPTPKTAPSPAHGGGGGNISLPAPIPLSGDTGTLPVPGPADNGDGAYSPGGTARPSPTGPPTRVVPGRPDLTTDGPKPDWRPPTTTIPSPALPSVLPPTSQVDPGKSQSRTVRPKAEFVLIDTSGRPREFPTGRADDLILLDFMTTTCVPCKKTVPTMKALQSKYGTRGLEVVGVCCDDSETSTRRISAGEYQKAYSLNYLVYVEPGSRPGTVMKKFRVEWFPTLVLLDGTGEELWRGDSRDLSKLEDVIRDRLSR